MSKKIVVKFLQTVSPYQTGEIAGFDPEIAEKLIAEKKAVEYKEGKRGGSTSEPPPPPTPPADKSGQSNPGQTGNSN